MCEMVSNFPIKLQMHLLLIWLQTEIFFLILMFTGWFNPRKAYSTGVATTQIYMLQQAIESVRL
jgi:hypothetical protein